MSCLLLTLSSSANGRCSWPAPGTKPVAVLAKDLGISESCLRNWMAQANADEVGGGPGRLTSVDKKELAELRRRNRQLETENEILKRAAAYFAQENVLPK
ncbi:transposase [Actinoplanes sp. M2I2]|uniref:transposase n=1 Tax=Actinoplanes sp. M2I2 TaxID=1734444 RepID=UPI0027E1535D|nr:transposase [Actinoplanes sp. M2I2]